MLGLSSRPNADVTDGNGLQARTLQGATLLRVFAAGTHWGSRALGPCKHEELHPSDVILAGACTGRRVRYLQIDGGLGHVGAISALGQHKLAA